MRYRRAHGPQTSDGHNHQSGSVHRNRPGDSVVAESLEPLFAGNPEPGFYHKPSERFLAQDNTVIFSKFFPRQCGAKIGISFPDET